MTIILATLVLAGALGLLLGGRLSNLSHLRIRWMPLAIVGLALQLVSVPSRTWGHALLYVSFTLLMAFALANVRARTPGAWLILVGIALNMIVIGVNGGMPVTREALVRSGQMDTLQLLVEEGGAKHHLAEPDDRLVLLGDVIPIRAVQQAVSIGDLFGYAGVVWLIVAGMRTRGDTLATATAPPSRPKEAGGVG